MLGLGTTELLIILALLGLVALAVLGLVGVVARAARRGRPAARPVEERLRELDDLRARGVISDEEHAQARARALDG